MAAAELRASGCSSDGQLVVAGPFVVVDPICRVLAFVTRCARPLRERSGAGRPEFTSAEAFRLTQVPRGGFVAATTALRFKQLEPLLRACAESFRAYPVKAPAFPGSLV